MKPIKNAMLIFVLLAVAGCTSVPKDAPHPIAECLLPRIPAHLVAEPIESDFPKRMSDSLSQ